MHQHIKSPQLNMGHIRLLPYPCLRFSLDGLSLSFAYSIPRIILYFSLLIALCHCGSFPVTKFEAETLAYPTTSTVVKKVTEYDCTSGDYNIKTYSMDEPYDLISSDHNRLPVDRKNMFNGLIESLDVAKYKNEYISRPSASTVDSSSTKLTFFSDSKKKKVFVNTANTSSVPEALSDFCTTVRTQGFI